MNKKGNVQTKPLRELFEDKTPRISTERALPLAVGLIPSS